MIRHGPGGVIWIPRADAALEAALDRRYERIPGTLSWKGYSKENKVVSFLKTVTSGFVDDETYEQRKQSCMQCPLLIKNAKGNFCGGCKCGYWKLAELDGSFLPKLKFKATKCPLGRPGFGT